jgi:hypothetical protein
MYPLPRTGIKIHQLIDAVVDASNVRSKERRENINSICMHLQNALKFHRRLQRRQVKPHKFARFLNLPYSTFYVTTVYLFTKLLYLINITFQLHVMNRYVPSV